MKREVRERQEDAQRLVSRGCFPEAADVYRELIPLAPHDARLQLAYAEACRHAGRFLQAVGAYRGAARLMAKDGERAEAIATLRLALALAPRETGILDEIRRLEAEGSNTTSFQPDGDSGVFPQLRRLTDRVIAFRASHESRWVLLHSQTPIELEFIDTLDERIEFRTHPDSHRRRADGDEVLDDEYLLSDH